LSALPFPPPLAAGVVVDDGVRTKDVSVTDVPRNAVRVDSGSCSVVQ